MATAGHFGRQDDSPTRGEQQWAAVAAAGHGGVVLVWPAGAHPSG